ncbi:MAG TPA: M15 family metallopeptidase [Verrucomicrobiota bacterium]|nr:D-alanyl-D-alanine carboxypeptidase [Verrucomicrobiales bacterium]HRI15893.1 M15 family metallopeptidase [Verrucomicrobiota bacterium]
MNPETYAARIAEITTGLGIPPDYAATRGLILQPEVGALVTARVLRNGRELQLDLATAAAWSAMVTAAAADQVTLLLLSGFRSVDYQRQIIERKLSEGQTLEQVLRVNAAPGYSEHHTGRAVDIGTPGCQALVEEFEQTAAFAWLARRAAEFGFLLSYPRNNPHGIIYEPWHWFHREIGHASAAR